jgi:hypothetical protein
MVSRGAVTLGAVREATQKIEKASLHQEAGLFTIFDLWMVYEATILPSTVTEPVTTMVCVFGAGGVGVGAGGVGVGVGAGGVGVGAGGVGVGAGGVGVGAGGVGVGALRAAKSFVTTGAPRPVQQS